MSKIDEKAPKTLQMTLEGILPGGGKIFFTDIVTGRDFSTGSKGYYIGGKMSNPESGEKYQISCNVTLIGSKPEKE